MKRRLFTLLCASSLALCLVTIGFWADSFRHGYSIDIGSGRSRYVLAITKGGVVIEIGSFNVPPKKASVILERGEPWDPTTAQSDGFGYDSYVGGVNDMSVRVRVLLARCWAAVLMFLLLPGFWLLTPRRK